MTFSVPFWAWMWTEKPNCYSSTAVNCAGNCFNCLFHIGCNENLCCSKKNWQNQHYSQYLPTQMKIKQLLLSFLYRSVLFLLNFRQVCNNSRNQIFPFYQLQYRNQLSIMFPLNQMKKIRYLFSRGSRSLLNRTKNPQLNLWALLLGSPTQFLSPQMYLLDRIFHQHILKENSSSRNSLWSNK